MEHHSEDDDVIESESTSSLNSDTDSNDFLVPEYENPGPDPDDLTALMWGREHYIRCFPEEKSRQVKQKNVCNTCNFSSITITHEANHHLPEHLLDKW